MPVRIGVENTARNVKSMYIGVNGLAKKISKMYVGDKNGLAKLVFSTGAVASLSPQSGVSYSNGLADLDPKTISIFSKAISNISGVTNSTKTVYVDYNDIHRKIQTSNMINIDLSGKSYQFRVLGFDHDVLADANQYGVITKSGKAGITFEMVNLFGTPFPANLSDINSGGWKESYLRNAVIPEIKSYLPEEWKNAIVSIKKRTGLGGGTSEGTEETIDDCFVISEIEGAGSISYSVSGEGTQYCHYKTYGRGKTLNGSRYTWFNRSPTSYRTNSWCYFGEQGESASDFASTTRGIALAFCL